MRHVDPDLVRSICAAAGASTLHDADIEEIAGCSAFTDDIVAAVGVAAARARLRDEPIDVAAVLTKLRAGPSPHNRWRALGPAVPIIRVLPELGVPVEPWAAVVGSGPPPWVAPWLDGLRRLPRVTVLTGRRDLVAEVVERAALAYALSGTPVLWHGGQPPPTVARRLVERLRAGHLVGVPAALALAPLWDAPLLLGSEPGASTEGLGEVVAAAGATVGAVVGDGLVTEPARLPSDPGVPVLVAGSEGNARLVETSHSFLVHVRGRKAIELPFAPASPPGLAAVDPTGAYLGWRLWQVGRDRHGPSLTSPVVGSAWPRGVIVARCATDRPCADPPQRACRCGVYAYAHASRAMEQWRQHRGFVLGQIRAWGRVAVHDLGFRASHAQLLQLLAPDLRDDDRRQLADRYECPVLGEPPVRHAVPAPTV